AYGLLQRAMGGEQLTGGDVRGAYMPIRGAYMPIRGPLLEDKPLTEADLAELRGLLDALAKEEAALASAIRENVPAYAEATTETPSGDELVKALAAEKDLAVLQYTLCDEGLVAVACGPGGRPRVSLIAIKGEDLWQQIGKFRELVWERKPEANQEAMRLFALLVAPLEGVLYGAKRVWVVADGALQLVPFGALIGSDRNYLVSRFAVATTPSLTLALSSRGQRQPGSGAVILAAPDTGAVTLAQAETDDKRGAYMPIRGMYMPIRGAYMPIRGEGVSSALTMMASVPLPGAKAEGEALAKLLPNATTLTDKGATKARLLSEGGKCDLLHIATHGYADPDVPEFSGLLLAGEGTNQYDTLTALEVYMWSLKARLVTLSACQTAMGKTVEGEGVMGLTRAFLYAGAQDVLCTLWPVADESTRALITAFYENLKTAPSIEEALREAQADLAAKSDTAHPFFWAGFVAVRGPE
ncbi:MAG: CHAT domain-containing protein, partial [Armatimonadetes bacterium]|nr:CHAT domain-containing protein [Armatimonadota bacterium]